MDSYHGTTILSVRRGTAVALGGDGQVTLGNVVIKQTARKVRRLYHDKILAGFAGGTADAFTLFERFEAKLEKHQGTCCARRWSWRRTGAPTASCDGWRRCWRWPTAKPRWCITGNGDVLEPEHGLVAIGSGGPYAQAAAKALLDNTELAPAEIIKKALSIAGDLCIYTNQQHVIEVLE